LTDVTGVQTCALPISTANIGLAKEAIHDNLGQPWRDGLEREARLQSMAYDTPAHEEGVDAFLNGRKPDFD
jgi:enoyl-CoA hydratase/carnithine racemase